MSINMLALVYAVFYIPGSYLAIALYARCGLSACIIGAAFFNLLACLIRYSSFFAIIPQHAFYIIMVGHVFAAVGSPLVFNTPSRVANDWFPKNERDFAISIMSQSNSIGGGLGGLLPALQVTSVADIPSMLFSQVNNCY
jgi:sugar phosphate permease